MHYEPEHPQHTWEEVADDGYIRTHREDGNALYVIDLAVRPAYRRLGLGKWLIFPYTILSFNLNWIVC